MMVLKSLHGFCRRYAHSGSVKIKQQLKETPLSNFHAKHGATMTGFAGFSMPLLYKEQSIIVSHEWTRHHCGLFDVSHMLQMRVHGKDRSRLVDLLTVADVQSLQPNQGTLSMFTNENGGIMDDLIVTNCVEGHYYIVSNAGCADKIVPHIQKWVTHLQNRGNDLRMDIVDNALIAVQGPEMKSVIQPGLDFNLDDLYFGYGVYAPLFDSPMCRITRCGYTGEDGVEISIPKKDVEKICDLLCENKKVFPIGLGARDTLRLEAGLCLYGNDIDETTSPTEAVLSWTVGKRRRDKNDQHPFLGHERILGQINKTVPIARKRIGLITNQGPPPRNGSKILDSNGSEIGTVTSGCHSPSLRVNIGMGYVKPKYVKSGTKIQVEIRSKTYDGEICKMPFVATNYYSPPKST